MARERVSQETATQDPVKRRTARVWDFPLNTHWLLTDPDVLALTRDELAGMLKVIAATYQTRTPGIMDEEQLRVWAGYSPDEWTAHRVPLLRLFTARPNARLVFREVWSVAKAQRERVTKARAAATVASLEAKRRRFERRTLKSGDVVQGQSATGPAGRSDGDRRQSPRAAQVGPRPGQAPPTLGRATGTDPAPPATVEGPDPGRVAALVAGTAAALHMRAGP